MSTLHEMVTTRSEWFHTQNEEIAKAAKTLTALAVQDFRHQWLERGCGTETAFREANLDIDKVAEAIAEQVKMGLQHYLMAENIQLR
jgi:hypothetical protein